MRRTLAIERRPEVEYALGVTYWHQGRSRPGRRRASGGDCHAGRLCGRALHARSRPQGPGELAWRAEASLRRAIALKPDLSAAHYLLGLVLQSTHDEAGAHAELAEAQRLRTLAASEQEAIVWTAVGSEKLDRGDAAGAVACFTRATALLEAYAPAHYQLGRALLQLGQTDAARAAFATARKLNPSLVAPDR